MEKILINEYHDYGGNMYNTLPEVNPATDIRAYKCIKCGTITLPTLSYNIPELDRKTAQLLYDIMDGKEIKPDYKMPQSRRPVPGYAIKVDEAQNNDPENHGKLIRIS
jgi:hypothetical protein